ncbi:carbohydrate ABC transporter permease [Culicoidibacter larvae]|uniref:Sugar ABC transporter permease n=1 Tax=Culicoidibacter larvae TaxID=2579976 RepID=A0A5R8QBQ9_9FIRM|nr:sugar ABC transporter permease [Culicoidibacter larvae]TLG72768.1 sugar ABC transporter permease [Culicoidibacter larvae]
MKRSKKSYLLLILPAVAMFSLVMIIPFVLGVYYSFTDWTATVGKAVSFIGLENYFTAFADATFIHSFLVTMQYAIVSIVVTNALAILMAMLVTRKTKLANLYRSGFFIPNLIGGIVLGYLWQFIFNNVLVIIGNTLGLEFLQQSLLANPTVSIYALVIVGSWQYAGYIMMIYVAALQNIPSEVLEASSLDGATGFQRLRHIIFPMVAPAFTISLFLTLVTAFKQFDINFALNMGGPGTTFAGVPVMASELLALNIYQTAFSFNQMGVAQAKSIIFFVVLVVIAIIQVVLTKRREIEA